MNRLIKLILLLILTLSLAACSNTEKSTDMTAEESVQVDDSANNTEAQNSQITNSDMVEAEDSFLNEISSAQNESSVEQTEDSAEVESNDSVITESTSDPMRFGFYLAPATLAKLDSLGTCVENEKIVQSYVIDSNYCVSISVYTWSDPESVYDTWENYYFYNSESGYDQEISLAESSGKKIAEQNKDELWIKYDNSDVTNSYQTYAEVYDFVHNSDFFNLVE